VVSRMNVVYDEWFLREQITNLFQRCTKQDHHFLLYNDLFYCIYMQGRFLSSQMTLCD
jgi:hypothetical protein